MDAIDAIVEIYGDADVEISDMMLVVAIQEVGGHRTNVLFHATDVRRYVQIGLLDSALEGAKYGEDPRE